MDVQARKKETDVHAGSAKGLAIKVALFVAVLVLALPDPVYFVIKRELARIPIWGPATLRVGFIAIDRGDTAQARAAVRGREYVIPDDVKALAPHVLTHRIIINPQTRLRGRTSEEVVMDVVDQVPVPVETL